MGPASANNSVPDAAFDDQLNVQVVDMDCEGPSKGVSTLVVAHKLRFVLFVVAVAVAGVILPKPSTQFVTLSFFAAWHGGGHCQLVPSSDPCRKASSDVTVYHGVASATAHSIAWLVALLAGSYSDVFGRRPFLIGAAFLSLLSRFALASHLFAGTSLWIFLLMEPMLTVFDIRSVFMAVMSDVVADPGLRVVANTLILGVAMSAAALSGLIGAAASARSAAILSISCVVVQIVFLLTCFPETAPLDRNVDAGGNMCHGCRNPIFVVRDTARLLLRSSFIFRVTLILLFTFISSAGWQSTLVPYLTGYLGFTQRRNGQLMMASGFSVALSFIFGMKPLLARFGNIGAIRVCLALKVVYCLLCALSWSPAHIFLVHALFLGPVVLIIPIMMALQSNLVGESEQGRMLGVLAAVKILATAVGELFFAWFYRHATDGGANPDRTAVLPPLLTAAGFAIVASVIAHSLDSHDSSLGYEPQAKIGVTSCSARGIVLGKG